MSAWKLISTVLVAAILVTGLSARPPRRAVGPGEMLRLVLAIAGLYLSGGAALVAHRSGLAAIAFAIGLGLCGLTLWLSRGADPPPPGDDRAEDPPPAPPPDFDWSFYEDQLRDRSPGRALGTSAQDRAARFSSQA